MISSQRELTDTKVKRACRNVNQELTLSIGKSLNEKEEKKERKKRAHYRNMKVNKRKNQLTRKERDEEGGLKKI